MHFRLYCNEYFLTTVSKYKLDKFLLSLLVCLWYKQKVNWENSYLTLIRQNRQLSKDLFRRCMRPLNFDTVHTWNRLHVFSLEMSIPMKYVTRTSIVEASYVHEFTSVLLSLEMHTTNQSELNVCEQYTDHVTCSREVPCDERFERQPLDWAVFIVAQTVIVIGEDVSR